jgi:hypothetical protein
MQVTGRSWVTQPSRRFDANVQLQVAPRWYTHWIKGAAIYEAPRQRGFNKDTKNGLVGNYGLRTRDRALADVVARLCFVVGDILLCASCGLAPHAETSTIVAECLANRHVATLRGTKGMSAKGRARFEVQAAEW